MPRITKARYWTTVLYPENMREDWRDALDGVLEFPYAFCVHRRDKDSKSEHRKDHVHLIVAYPNTTTYQHALQKFSELSSEGKQCCNTCQAVSNIRRMYDYLIHDTDDCRRKGKEPYPPEERICGNNFDIGAYEQLSQVEEEAIFLEICELIMAENFTNMRQFFLAIQEKLATDRAWLKVFKGHSSVFERLVRGNHHAQEEAAKEARRAEEESIARQRARQMSELILSEAEIRVDDRVDASENEAINTALDEPTTFFHCCLNCGAQKLVKSGKTLAGTQRFKCTACGKVFAIASRKLRR